MQSSRDNKVLKTRGNIDIQKYIVYIIFLFVTVIFALWMGGKFFSIPNLLNIVRQSSSISVMAVAMTFVIAAGGIDLSVSGILPLAAAFAAKILLATDNILLAVFAPILLGVLIGLINGLLITKLNMPSFLVTLGMMGMLKGFAMWITATQSVPIYNKTFSDIFGGSTIGGVPSLLIWTLVALAIGHFVLTYLPFGRKVLAIGGNKTAAKYTGIKVDKIIILTFIFSSVSAVIAGYLYTGRMETSRYNFGEGDELSIIAAVVLGGTGMYGGTGTVIGAVVGSLLMGMINNGLIIGGLDVSQQMVVRGFIIILAVALSNIAGLKRKV